MSVGLEYVLTKQVDQITRERDELKAKVAELEKDRARLDWLDVEQVSLYPDCEEIHDIWCLGGLDGQRFNTPRQAIDAAMERKES